ATSKARDEQASTEALSFRCNCERWRLEGCEQRVKGVSRYPFIANSLKRGAVPAFTLAEVLITLAIIGVVAAMTLPTLIAKVNEKVDGNQKKVTEAKLIQGLNMLDLHGGINNTYSSTAEFVEELSKYMKITKICDGTNTAFSECIPYSEITYNNGTEDKTVEITKLNTAKSLGKNITDEETEFMAPVAMVLADGTPMFLTYNKKCISDPDSIKDDNKSIHKCVDGIYDLNGSRKPNKYGKDLVSLNSSVINIGSPVLATIGELEIIKFASVPKPADCSKYIGKIEEIKTCPYSGESDYWVGALAACDEIGGHMPDKKELATIATELLGRNVGEEENIPSGSINFTSNEKDAMREKVKDLLGINTNGKFVIYSTEEKITYNRNTMRNMYESTYRYFDIVYTTSDYYTSYGSYSRNIYGNANNTYYVCIAD
ncbi:type II secretion system protein, partial [bacterium]|nr:type II secretion system protein [bacterium]